ncbi:hypothetical protein RF11_04234 [Thelohanellus kitauei]|uniref:Uncharacterized protein n=1 Tax=Thelohanellus kitauei TaxID=669202 RepID=A0A0C2MLJ1_THEKT|nr:hypothetical protein RF11_04234 [Thelohanellus kitauei]
MSKHLPMIHEDLIYTVFTDNQFLLNIDFPFQIPDVLDSFQYTVWNEIMITILDAFNESKFLTDPLEDPIIVPSHEYTLDSNPLSGSVINLNIRPSFSLLTSSYILNKHTNQNGFIPFRGIFKWFILLYEYKCIFGDINSKFYHMNIHPFIHDH